MITPTITATTNGRLTNLQSVEVMALLGDVDSVELKASIPAPAHQSAIKGLPLDPVEAEPRQAFFFDTPTLDLNRAGVVVRARRIRGGGADTVVKIRPVVPADLPDDLRRSGAFKVELDALPGGFVCSGSLKGKASGEDVNAVVDGRMSLRKLLSREQRAFYADHAPGDLDLDELVPLGPTFLQRQARRRSGERCEIAIPRAVSRRRSRRAGRVSGASAGIARQAEVAIADAVGRCNCLG